MTFTEAKNWRLPFGNHAGMTLDEVAETDDGLRYLDWLVDQEWLRQEARGALVAYLEDPTIAKDLAELE